jgi:hypothetical protein
MQPKLRLVVFSVAVSLLVVLVDPASALAAPALARPAAGPCTPSASYDATCDVDHDGDVDVLDIQLAAGHWGHTGIWSSGSWDLTGNAGTTAGTNFLGTTDIEALELRVAGQRALRLEPAPAPPDGAPAGGALTPNVIGGHEDNTVTTYVQGATIGGGGSAGFGHEVLDNFGVIGGGFDNRAGNGLGTLDDHAYATVGGGANNWASGLYATVSGGAFNAAHKDNAAVAGGKYNLADADFATVGGGYLNQATSNNATVAGGANNQASGNSATVAGGANNQASGNSAAVGGGSNNTASGYSATVSGYLNQATGDYATVAGGYDNAASGNYSFAAGRRAKANHNGAFVWADSAGTEFASTAGSQFLVRAAGGVGINTNAPNAALAVDGGNSVARIAVNSNSPTANAGLLLRQDGVSRWAIATVFSDGDLSFFREGVGGGSRLFIDGGGANVGYVGIGNAAPQHPLHMASGAYVTTGGVWTNASSRALKVDFVTVDRAALLRTLATLPIATWSYRAEGAGVRHLGPTAEDFYAAFGLGDGGAAIGTVDADGVALAAAQALYQLTQAQQAELAAQQARIERLAARLAALEQEVAE